MKILVLVLVMLVPSISSAQDEKHEKLLHSVIAANVTAHFVDNATTQYAMGYNRGSKTNKFKEANPLLRSFSNQPVPMALVKGGVATAQSVLWIRYHKKHPKIVMISAISSTLLTSLVSYKNYKQLEKLK